MIAAAAAKKAGPDIAATWADGALISWPRSTRPGGGAPPPPSPHRLSGTAVSPAWNLWTFSKSDGPLVWVRPIIHAIPVGQRISSTPAGSRPCQPGPVTA